MAWTKRQYIDNWPDSPNPYSRSDEVFANGQLVDESAMLRAMDAHDRLMAKCICDYDGGYGDDGSQVRRFPVKGCPVHAEEDGE